MKKLITSAVTVAALATGATVGPASSAEALEVKPGHGFAQTDILLNSYETRQAATRPSMAWWYCSLSVPRSPGLVGVYSSGACAMAVNASAAYALKRGKRAGLTMMPWGSWWNWTY